MSNPLADLQLHCKYHWGLPLCPTCRKQLLNKAGIIHDFFGYKQQKIFRIIYFYSPLFQEIRMKFIDPPTTLINEESWNIFPLNQAYLFDPHSKKSDRYGEPGDFQDALEELYTWETFLENEKAKAELKAKKHKPLY